MNKAKFVTEQKGKEAAQKSPPPLNICIVINILYYLKPFSKVIMLAEPLDNIGSDIERSSFLALRQILATLESGKNDPINIYPFLDKFCHVTSTNLHEFECLDVSFIWDSVIKLVTVVIPPLREVFLGRISSSLDIPSWLNLISRCFHAQFLHPTQTLEEVMRATLVNYVHDEDDDDDIDDGDDDSEMYDQKSPADRIRGFNAKVLYRSPEILVFAVESTHLPLPLRFTDMFTRANGRAKPPTAIQFPESFDVSAFLNECNIANSKKTPADESKPESERETTVQLVAPRWYDLTSVVTLEGAAFDSVEAYYRCLDKEDSQQWLVGSGAHHEPVDKSKVVEGNYFNASDARKVHPRLLIYTKRGMTAVLDRLGSYVTKAGQMRSLGDATFESAETPEHYDEAKHYYEEAIAYDPSLRPVLQERLTALDLIERNQRAHCYETQADISLGRRRFKEACDLYKSAMRCAVVNSPLYLRIREKEDYMMKIISLEIANHLTEKGQDCLRTGCFAQGKEHFLQAMKLNPSYIHLQTIIAGIDQAITVQTSAQKVAEANQAMKLGKYKQANQLFQESINLIPEREASLKSVLESLVGLMQGEEALAKQRAGLVALEDKKYILAIDFITEAIGLLPKESVMEHAFFLCDRAQVYFEMKEYLISIEDCKAALALRPDLAMGYLRLGAALFELERYDEAIDSYEKAIRNDSSLSDQVKVKMRQVNTAKEILQRKEREAERARIQEEQKRALEERRAKDEAAKKSRQQKLLEEKAEKGERSLMREEELLMTKFLSQLADATKPAEEPVAEAASAPVSVSDKTKGKKEKEKSEKELQKAQERERARQDKEKEREKAKAAKEAKLADERRKKEEELQRQREFTAEMERVQNRTKEIEREKEVEREKARLERERVIAEREKAREEKVAEAKKVKQHTVASQPAPAPAASSSTTAVAPTTAAAVVATPAPAARDSSIDLIPSIFAGAAKVTVKLSNKGREAVPAAPLGTNSPGPAAASSVAQPGAKWSALLTPPASATPASPAPSFKQQTSQFTNPYSVNNRRASDPANDFPPLGDPGDVHDSKGKNGSFQSEGYQFGASSAWADHERAMLEATAERISVRDATPAGTPKPPKAAPVASSSSASPAPFVPQAEPHPPAPALLPAATASFQPTRQMEDVSPLLSKLGIGATGSAPPASASSGASLIHRTHLPADNDDHDINLLLSSSLEPLPGLSNNDFGVRAGRPNGSLVVDALGGGMPLLGGSSLGMSDFSAGSMNLNFDASLDRALNGGFGGNDSYASLLGPSSLSQESSLLGGVGSSGGGLFSSGGDGLFGVSRSKESDILNGLLGGGPVGGSTSSNLLSPTTSSALGLGSIGGLSRGTSDGSHAFAGKSNGGDFLHSRGTSGTFGSDLDMHNFGLGLPPPASDPLLGSGSLSSLLNYNPTSSSGGHDFGGFGADSNGFSGMAFPNPQRTVSNNGGFGLGAPLSRGSSGTSPFLGGGVLPPPTPPLLNLGSSALGGMSAGPPNLSSLLDFAGVRNPTLGNPGTSSSSAPFGIAETTTSVGIDSDVVPENYFPSVAWLRAYNMHMYRWAGNAQEWTDYAMHIPREMYPAVYADDGGLSVAVADVSRRSGCKMWKETEILRGNSESFLVFHKGSDGQPTHQAMLAALELMSALLRPWVAASLPRSTTPVMKDSFLGAVSGSAALAGQVPASGGSRVLAATAAASSSPLPPPPALVAAPTATVPALATTAPFASAPAAVPAEEFTRRERPPLLKVPALPAGGYLQRYLEIPREVVGLIIGQGGKKIKELCTESGAKIQFRVNKTAEREGRPGMLEVHGSQENVDKALHLIWELLQLLGKEYNEVPASSVPKSTK
jgi:tetratricopeptide (TPR) repeat protein